MEIMPVHMEPTGSGWYAALGPLPPASRLGADVACDHLIVGGGWMGLHCARRLGELAPDARVVLVDAGRIGDGAAGRCAGFAIDLAHNPRSKHFAEDKVGNEEEFHVNVEGIAYLREARLSELGNFNYIKDSGGDLCTHQQYLQTQCKVLNGADTTTVYAMMAGATGTVWGGANYMPHEAVALYSHVQAGEYAEALALWNKMLPSLLHIWTTEYVQAVLAAAQHQGYGTGHVRAPLRPWDQAKRDSMIATLAPLIE